MKNNMKNVTNNPETIGDLVWEHITNNETWICLNDYYGDYLNEEDKELFSKLTQCTDGFIISAEFDNGDVVVSGNESRYKTYYDSYYPVACVYKDMLTKMTDDLKQGMKSVKEQYVENKDLCKSCMFENEDLRIWKTNDAETYDALIYFGEDYGIEIKEGYDPYKGMYVDIIGINE